MNIEKKRIPKWDTVALIIFDFDGVFTNNKVYLNNKGEEFVSCSRSDGLAFDLLRNFITQNSWDLKYFILSKESNSVVKKRAEKLKIPCFNAINNKIKFIEEYLEKNKISLKSAKKNFIYVGNDLNDLAAIQLSDFGVVPQDAHPLLLEEADMILPLNGGDGFVRLFIEKLLQLDDMSIKNIVRLLDT
tara:strand:+ start:23 stop:586 length:564 start_codon:yes stop_codon:yes gene_type:complete